MGDNKKKTNPVIIIFGLIGLIGVTMLSSVGLLYVLHGNILVTAIISIAILASLAMLTKFLKDDKIKDKTRANKKPEIILITVYFIIAIISFPFIFHFINVDFSKKNELKTAGIEKAKTITDLIEEYNIAINSKIESFETKVDENLSEYIRTEDEIYKDSLIVLIGEIDFTVYSSQEIKEQAEKAKKDEAKFIEDKYALGKIEISSETYVKNAKAIFEGWKLLKVSHAYYDIDNEYQKLYKVWQKKKCPILNTQHLIAKV